MNETAPKPYFRTSYFWIMIASIAAGPPLLWLTTWVLTQLPLTDAQDAQALQTVFSGWISIVTLTTSGNVLARGGVTLLKTWMQQQFKVRELEASNTTPLLSAAVQGIDIESLVKQRVNEELSKRIFTGVNPLQASQWTTERVRDESQNATPFEAPAKL